MTNELTTSILDCFPFSVDVSVAYSMGTPVRSAHYTYSPHLSNSHLFLGQGVMKSVMGELTDSTNRAEGFAYMPIVWATGATLG
ncbi:hypothetical protein H0H93_011277, partial [Arthromyces matolae]